MDGSIKTIGDLIKALEELDKKAVLEKDSDLRIICEEAFKRLQISKYFRADDVTEDLIILKNLPDSIKSEEIGKIDFNAEKLDPKSLNKQDLDSLVKDYEEAKDKAVRKVYEQEIFKRTGKENIDQFIKGQKEIAARNKERLEKIEKIDPKLKGEIETKLEKVEQGMEEVKAKKIEDMVLEEKDYKKKELEKEVQKIVNDKEKAREISQEIIRERAEIKVVKSADEMATKICEELKNEQVVVTEKTRVELKENILKSWEDGEKVVVPEAIKTTIQDQTIIKRIESASENFKNENLETIVNYRAEKLKKEIVYELRNNGVKDEKLISEYAEVTVEVKYSTERIIPEVNSQEIADQIYAAQENGRVFEVQPENAVKEAKEMASYLVKSPRKFNNLVDRYNVLREKIGSDKLPKIEKLRVTDKMMRLFKNGSQARNWINGAQRIMGFVDKINNFPANLLTRFGFQDIGLKLVERIGGQAAATFVKNAALTIAEKGTFEGIKTILMGLLGKGAAAGGAAAGGAAAGGAIAGLVSGPVGWIVTAAMLALDLLKKIGGKISGWAKEHLNINLGGVKDFFENTLNLGKGGALAVIAGVGTFLAGIPVMLSAIGPLVGIVFVAVILFITGYSISNLQTVSTLVPPADTGNCVLKSDYGGEINCNPNAPTNTVAGLNKSSFVDVAKRWKDGTNYADTCYNDTVNRALCKGINPAYALWAWLHESGASNYTGASDIEDFGMHSIPENEDFNTQINAFLEIDPAKGCISDPRMGGDYWLAFSAAYLNGKNDCDPDKKNAITGMTPREYEAELKNTWSWVSSAKMPNSIYVTAGGQNCDTAFQAYYEGNDKKEITDSEGNVWVCSENNSNNYTASMVPATPIYDNDCSISPAYCVVDYLINNKVEIINSNNVEKVEKLIDQWTNAPKNFNKSNFNSAMYNSATYVGPDYVFQCVGFAVAINPILGKTSWGGSVSTWEQMLAHGSADCPRIEPSGAGVGDFILFKTAHWYHIVVLSKLNKDGSYTISQANWGAPGKVSNVEGDNITSYLKDKSVLRCK